MIYRNLQFNHIPKNLINFIGQIFVALRRIEYKIIICTRLKCNNSLFKDSNFIPLIITYYVYTSYAFFNLLQIVRKFVLIIIIFVLFANLITINRYSVISALYKMLIYNINKIRESGDPYKTPALKGILSDVTSSKQSLINLFITKLFTYLIAYIRNPFFIKIVNNRS